MTSHSFNTRNKSLASNGDGPENSIEISPESSSDNRVATLETCGHIINLEKKISTRFDSLDKELLNIKDFIIKDLQIKNQRLRSQVKILRRKLFLLKKTETC